MRKIIPAVLKRLRLAKGWSQEQLAEKSKIDKQTIWRLEHGEHTKRRESTIRNLAVALRTDPAVLTGETPLPETQEDESGDFLMSKLSLRISTAAHNAFFLVTRRYHITYQDIVELAPLLFCWAAEASLRQRRERLEDAKAALEHAQHVEFQMRHLPPSDSPDLKQKFEAEEESIDNHDIFGMSLYYDHHFGSSSMNEATDNPFALFLQELACDTGGNATFEHYIGRDFPEYSVCPDEAALVAQDDPDLVKHIFQGHILLDDMPKELRSGGPQRTEWVRAKVKDYQEEMRRMIENIKTSEASS